MKKLILDSLKLLVVLVMFSMIVIVPLSFIGVK